MWHNYKVLADTVNIKPRKDPKNSSSRKLRFVKIPFLADAKRHLNGKLGETNQISKHELTYTRIVPSAY